VKVIHKYIIDAHAGNPASVSLPAGAEILSVQAQRSDVVIWALIDDDVTDMLPRKFQVYGTGWAIKERVIKHWATLQCGSFVWHVLEVV
jgi:hypothetical protein